ncbi:hypothetical protein [Hymenobacter sp.]|jgi:hypothetical protein|uniref:hypothetical protein n=1 Tax=Hymenobacter sp. TaxID=1898978 RepID=UPI002EDA4560
MQLKFTRETDFRQERDFGAKIGSTFEFLGAHWRPLGKCLAYFVLPVSLLAGIGLGLVTNGMWNVAADNAQSARNGTITASASSASMFGVSYFVGVGLAIVSGVIAFTMLLSTLYAYTRILLTEEPNVALTPARVWKQIKAGLGRMLAAMGTLCGLYMLLAGGFVALVSIVGGGAGMVVVFLVFLVLMPVILYVMVPLSLFFPALWMENSGVLETLRRCFYLVRGNWWASFGLLLVAGMIQGMLTFLFILPQYAVMFGKILKIPVLGSDAFGIAAQCFYALGITFTYSVSLLAMLFQYFHLVEEKEGLGMRNLVDSLGNGPAPVAYNSTYRPDGDGEY